MNERPAKVRQETALDSPGTGAEQFNYNAFDRPNRKVLLYLTDKHCSHRRPAWPVKKISRFFADIGSGELV